MSPARPAQPDDTPAASSSARVRLAAVILIVAVGLAYSAGLTAPFLFDDNGAVVNNPTIRHLWSFDILRPPADGSTTTGRPFVNLTYAVNYAISGEQVWSYHALNVAIHMLAAVTLFGVLRRTFSLSHFASVAAAFAAALLWALHPLQTESVVCIAQRTESLCGLFYLLTLYAFIRSAVPPEDGARLPPRVWLALSVVACLLGMATKEVMATAPLAVLLFDRTFFAESFAGALWARRNYYAALASTWLLLAWLVLRGGGARGVSAGFGLGVSAWSYLLKQSEALMLYLKLALWPHPLVLDYGTAVAHSLLGVWWQSLAVLGLLSAAGWAVRRNFRTGFAAGWFFLILAPSSSVVPLVAQTMAEHRMYLPLAGVIALGTAASFRVLGSLALWPLAAGALAFGGTTALRCRDYRDPLAIWADNVASYPASARAQDNFAWALQQRGNFAEANVHFARAIALSPDYATAHYDWGVALLDQHRADEAIAQFEAALRVAPGHADAALFLGNALMQVQRVADALPHYEQALRLKPGADVHYNIGAALLELGRRDEAVAHLQAALQLNASLPEAHYQLGRAAEQGGRTTDAEREFSATLQLAPDHLGAHRRLGVLLAQSGRLAPAAEQFRAVLRQKPDDADARANLGNVLLLQGDARAAIEQYETSLRLRPGDTRTQENLRLARESLP